MSVSALAQLRIHHAGLSVPDLAASIAWYQQMLGFELERQHSIPQIPAQIAFMRHGNFRLELFEVEGAELLPPARRDPHADLHVHGHKHLCFGVPDVTAAFAGFGRRGAEIVLENVIDGTPMGFLRDNTGNLLELIQVAVHPTSTEVSP